MDETATNYQDLGVECSICMEIVDSTNCWQCQQCLKNQHRICMDDWQRTYSKDVVICPQCKYIEPPVYDIELQSVNYCEDLANNESDSEYGPYIQIHQALFILLASVIIIILICLLVYIGISIYSNN